MDQKQMLLVSLIAWLLKENSSWATNLQLATAVHLRWSSWFLNSSDDTLTTNANKCTRMYHNTWFKIIMDINNAEIQTAIMSGQMNYTGLQVDHRFWQLTQVPQGHQKRSTGWGRGGGGSDTATTWPHLYFKQGLRWGRKKVVVLWGR